MQCEEEKHHTWDKSEADTCQSIGEGFQGKYKTGKRTIGKKNSENVFGLRGNQVVQDIASTEISPRAGNMVQQGFQTSYEHDGR